MKKSLFLCFVFILTGCSSNFIDPGFKFAGQSNRTIAIIPFDVMTSLNKIPAGTTLQMLQDDDERYGIVMQRDVYRYLLRAKSTSESRIWIQDVNKTNMILKEKGINYKNLRMISRMKLAELIDVDCVLSGEINQHKWKAQSSKDVFGGISGYVSRVNATLTLHNKTDGRLLWHYKDKINGEGDSNSNALARVVLRNAAKNFPLFRR